MSDEEIDALEAVARRLQKRGATDAMAVQEYDDRTDPAAILALIQRVRESEADAARDREAFRMLAQSVETKARKVSGYIPTPKSEPNLTSSFIYPAERIRTP